MVSILVSMPIQVTYDDLVFNIGKNAEDNWNLIDHSVAGDIWIHLHNHPSAHVVIENTKEIEEDHILYACELCKERSKMKFKKGVKCCVLDIKYVKKTKKKGEVKLLKDPKIVKI